MIINIVACALLGGFMAYQGWTVSTYQYWVVMALVAVIYFNAGK